MTREAEQRERELHVGRELEAVAPHRASTGEETLHPGWEARHDVDDGTLEAVAKRLHAGRD